MYRILLVDDEPLILAGITSLLEWEEYGYKIVGKAGNGQQALAQMEELRPDIVITDIKMPAMDGIALMQEARNRKLTAQFILLTNLEEFKLVKEALHLGAVDYLVKLELTEERLLESLSRAAEKVQQIREENSGGLSEMTAGEAAKSYFQSVLIYETEPRTEESFRQRMEERYRHPVVMMVIFNYGVMGFSKGFTREDQKKTLSFAEDILTQMIQGFFENYCILRQEQNGFIVVLEAPGQTEYKQMLQNLSGKMISVIHDYFEVPVSVSVSRRGEGIGECKDLLYQAMASMNHYYYDDTCPVLFYSEEYEADARHISNFNISFLKKDLSVAIRGNAPEKFMEIMGQIIELLKEYRPSKLQAVNACTNLYYFITSLFEKEEDEGMFPYAVNIMETLNHINSIQGVIMWISDFSGEVEGLLKERNEAGTDKYVELAVQYVREHLRDKITLAQVAEQLGISQGYLSSTFKKSMNRNFTDFVTEEKMALAKEMLAEHKYMMYEISDALGFDNQYYFSTVFKKLVGCSPREYEMQIPT